MLFVADIIPDELKRIIEFLSAQMTRAQVFGVEIRQYKGANMTTLVPRVFPQTMSTEDGKVSTGAAARSPDVVPTIIAAQLIPDGAVVNFDPGYSHRKEIMQWMALQPNREIFEAEWRGDEKNTLLWKHDNKLYSTTGLALKIYEMSGFPLDKIRGPACWTYEGRSLVALANEDV